MSFLGRPDCLLIGEVAQAHDGSLGTAHAFIDAIEDSMMRSACGIGPSAGSS